MSKISYAVKIDSQVVNRMKNFCQEHGIKQGFFVEKALREQVAREELLEDQLDLKNLRHEEDNAIDFAQYLKRRPA